MGDSWSSVGLIYIFTVDCPKCGFHDDEAYYAPIKDWLLKTIKG